MRSVIVLTTCLVLVLCVAGVASAREYKIVVDNQTYYYDLNGSKIAVGFASSATATDREVLLSSLPAVGSPAIERTETPLGMTIVRLKTGTDEQTLLATLSTLEAASLVDWSAPVLMYDGLEHVPTPNLYIQFDPSVTKEQVDATIAKYGLTLIKSCDDWSENTVYVKRPKGTGVESLDLSDAFIHEPGVVWAEPDFNRLMRFGTNDTYYTSQWFLNQASDADIDAPEAWGVTTGSTSIVISICDVGVQIAHEDLSAHVNTGYDATDGGNDPTPNTTYADDGHGTCCAGLAAAVTNNSLGVAGVGYNCHLIGTRIGYITSGGYIQTSDTWIVNCITYSRDHADVQSDSWGGGTPSSTVNNALTQAKGAGLTILFAAGNDNSSIQWPATQASVIAVGATDEYDDRCYFPGFWGSNYGSQLDVVAPGTDQYVVDDSRAGAGYNPSGAYYSSFGGTSGACPVAAGVCALILSVNPALIPDSVQAILQRTANDLVGRAGEDVAGWDQYMGWGRVNAYSAVLAAGGNIHVTAPNGGENWVEGASQNITWTSSGITGNVNIELNRTYPGGTWESVAANTANDGTQPWTVTLPASTTARIRITSINSPSVSDVSDANFNIIAKTITVTAPNGGKTWIVGDANNITWTYTGLSENVHIKINRTYPSATWSDIIASTANTGTYSWTVTSPTTTTARIRISGTVSTGVKDTSNANFTIGVRSLTVSVPNGGEIWPAGTPQNVTWTSQNLTGTVNIQLNRTYPSATWENIAMATANDGTESWTVTSPATGTARMRIISVSYPTVGDTSNNNFTITVPNQPPTLFHNPLDDQSVQPFNVTAKVTDDAGGFVTKMYYRMQGGVNFDSLQLNATGNPNEFFVSINSLAPEDYEYYVKVRDAGGLTTQTSLSPFTIGATCGTETAYDDGDPESSQWSQNKNLRWAVRFDPVGSPYVLCAGRVGISALHPDTTHSVLSIQVLAADGPGGLPGTLLYSKTIGSIGNVIGGIPPTPANWATIVFRDASNNPLSITGNFYVAVANPDSVDFEAFLNDTSSAYAGHSFVFDPCDSAWWNENSGDPDARRGNRMIRVSGYGLVPPQVVIHRVGNDIRLDWQATGAPYYRIYWDTVPNGAFTSLLGSTPGTTFTDVNPLGTLLKFYVVKASNTP